MRALRPERIIEKKWAEFRDPRSNDCLKRLNKNLIDISNIMSKNINDLILRGENLEGTISSSRWRRRTFVSYRILSDVGRRADELKEKSQMFASEGPKWAAFHSSVIRNGAQAFLERLDADVLALYHFRWCNSKRDSPYIHLSLLLTF